MRPNESIPEPEELLRQFRRSFTDLRRASGASVYTPAEYPLSEDSLPQSLHDLLAEYRRSFPEIRLTIVKYARFVNGDPRLVVDDDTGLPPDPHLMTISHTVTLNSFETVRVVTDLYVLRRD